MKERLADVVWGTTENKRYPDFWDVERVIAIAEITSWSSEWESLHERDFEKIFSMITFDINLLPRKDPSKAKKIRDVCEMLRPVVIAERQNRFVKRLEEESRSLQQAAVKMSETAVALQNENNEIADASRRIARSVERLTIAAVILAAIAVGSNVWLWFMSR